MGGVQYTDAHHPPFDDPNVYIFYRYYPSLPAAVIFIVCFFVSTFLHIWQTKRSRSWYFIALIVGGFFEWVGYVGRALSSHNQWLLSYYIMQAALLLVAPALFAASVYMMLGKIMVMVDGQKYSILPMFWVTKLFVCGDILSFITQGAGAGLMAGGTQQKLEAGEHMVVAGLALQIFSFGFFVIVALVFHRRLLRNPTPQSLPESGNSWQKYLKLLYGASLLILIRSVFRVIEYSMGNDGFLLRTEVFLYIFDAVLMLCVMVLFNIFHPGAIVKKNKTSDAAVAMEENISVQENSSIEQIVAGGDKTA